MASLIDNFVEENNPLLIEIQKIKERLDLLENKFSNEIQKRRGPKTKLKTSYDLVEEYKSIQDIIFIERDSNDSNFEMIIISNDDDNVSGVIEITIDKMKELLKGIDKSDQYINISDYNLCNKLAKRDNLGDWVLTVHK